MLVYKFGGGTVKDADSIKQLKNISGSCNQKLVIVISALNKVTNQLENLCDQYFSNSGEYFRTINIIKDYHYNILHDLIPSKNNPVYDDINSMFSEIEIVLKSKPTDNYDYTYDQIVSYGELFSTKIISAYLNLSGINNSWLDARDLIKTDDTFREAQPNWEICDKLIRSKLNFTNQKIYLTQGFIASDKNNKPTTLGREGSDFSAALFAYILNAQKVIIWKDVEGILNADPADFTSTILLKSLSYHEAIEMAFYGAKVIHPRTIKPLQNKDIPLLVKAFNKPENPGTIIHSSADRVKIPPIYIFKKNQVLISILPRDFSFIVENNISNIFSLLAKYQIKVNLIQNSAISFSVCVNSDERKIPLFIKEIKNHFKVLYNKDLTLITIRHYTDNTINEQTSGRKMFIQQKSRKTARFVVS